MSEGFVPVWIDDQGFEWTHVPVWEGCEYGVDPFDPDHFDPLEMKRLMQVVLTGNECPNPVEFLGERGRIHFQLCRKHLRKRHIVRVLLRNLGKPFPNEGVTL